MPGSLETLFVRYRTTGEPEPLGEVFDRTSPQLLAVALHLCAHPADAEDALQATFVAAIDAAASWQADRALLPWLLGILTRQCRRIGERRGRRREWELPAEPLVLDDGSPLAASERRELVAQLREHIERLPAEQRQVLLLQLEHGLAPAEVAEVLGVAPGTVRMRLHRGLQTLRGVLPASLVALVIAALPARGVAAVRDAVVGHAAVVGGAVFGGVFLMKKLVALAVVVVLAGLGLVLWGPAWQTLLVPHLAPAAPAEGRLVEDRHAAEPPTPPAPERIAVVRSLAPDPVAATAGTGSLRVLTLFDDGSPLPNQPVQYWPDGDSPVRPFAPRSALTDLAGFLQIEGLAVGRWHVVMMLGADRQAEVVEGGVAEARFVIPARDSLRSYTMRCRVVHADGHPAVGATVVVGAIGSHPGAVPLGVTDAEGRLSMELAGTMLVVGARLAGYAPAPLTNCHRRPDLTLVLPGPEAVVQGFVVDADGHPVARAMLEFGPRQHWTQGMDEVEPGIVVMPPTPQVVVTDAEGRFTVGELTAVPRRVRIRAEGFAAFETVVAPVAGQVSEVRWQLGVASRLQGQVVDEQGLPVRASVALDDERGGEYRVCTDAGSFEFLHAPSDVQQVHVHAAGFAPRVVEPAAARPGAAPIVLRRWPRYDLRLVDERQQPLVNWPVCLVPREGERQRTDEAGRLQIAAATFGVPQLLVSPPLAVDAVIPLPWPTTAMPAVPCDIVVPDAMVPTAEVRGVVIGADGAEVSTATVELRSPTGDRLAAAERAGRFHFVAVPAGDWQLWVRRSGRHTFDPPVPVPTVKRGEVRDVGNVRAPAEGTLRVQVRTADGRRPAGLSWRLFDARQAEYHAPPDGRRHPLPCGRLQWQVQAEDAAWSMGETEVREGQLTDLEVVLPPGVQRTLRVHLPPSWRGAQRDVELRLYASDGRVVHRDPHAWPVVGVIGVEPCLSVGDWRVEVVDGDGRVFAGSFGVASLTPSWQPIDVAVVLGQ